MIDALGRDRQILGVATVAVSPSHTLTPPAHDRFSAMLLRRGLFPRMLLAFGCVCVPAPFSLAAQERATVSLEENFRREPNGLVLAQVSAGTEVRVLAVEANWTQVELEGWVWLRSMQRTDDQGMDLVVTEPGGENLRAGPSGTILARLEEGTLLEELGRDPAWGRVSRVGWIWSASLSDAAASGGPASSSAGSEPVEREPTAAAAAQTPGGVRSAPQGGPILAAPDGDTLAIAEAAADLEVVRREGSWARVRLEGWMWMPQGQEAGPSTPAQPTALEPADLAADPEAYAGRVVAWTVQFISLERAEVVRTDFFEGEPFLLTRFGDSDGPFVYVAVPPARVTEVDGLVPLERVLVTGRVRTGASRLTGAPILDLMSIERTR